nr:uncharacterized protein LOC120101839 [Rattus norvegicus]
MGTQVLFLKDQDQPTSPQPDQTGWLYTTEDTKLLQKMGSVWYPQLKRWVYTGKTVMPTKMTFELISYLHKFTHLGLKKMKTLLRREEIDTYLLGRDQAFREVTESCRACAQVNPGKAKIGQGVRPGGHRPGTHWEIDLTKIKPGMYGHKYLLVFIDTFSGWVEAFPTKHETAKVVTKKLLEEVFPSTSSGPTNRAERHLETSSHGLPRQACTTDGAAPIPDRRHRVGAQTSDQESRASVERTLYSSPDYPDSLEGRWNCSLDPCVSHQGSPI